MLYHPLRRMLWHCSTGLSAALKIEPCSQSPRAAKAALEGPEQPQQEHVWSNCCLQDPEAESMGTGARCWHSIVCNIRSCSKTYPVIKLLKNKPVIGVLWSLLIRTQEPKSPLNSGREKPCLPSHSHHHVAPAASQRHQGLLLGKLHWQHLLENAPAHTLPVLSARCYSALLQRKRTRREDVRETE